MINTFKDLRIAVGSTKGKLPTAKALNQRKDILLQATQDDALLTVYSSGHILYQKGLRTTVFTVERCKSMNYKVYEMDEKTKESYRNQGFEIQGNILSIPEREYENEPWFKPLFLIGEEVIFENEERIYYYHAPVSIAGDGSDWNERLRIEDPFKFETTRELQIAFLKDAMDSLTPKQMNAVQLYYYQGMTELEIANMLGISHQGVHKLLSLALKKLQKIFKKWLPEKSYIVSE